MRVLVTGGTGFLGQHLVHALLTRNHQVRVLGRNETVCRALSARGVDVRRGDLRDAEAVQMATSGMDVVYHVGALSAPWGSTQDFHAINVQGTASVIAGCHRHGVRRLVYVSSPSVVFSGYDQVNLTEKAPYPRRFLSVYSLTKKLGEEAVKAAGGAGLETIILRPKAMFGPGDTTLLPRLLDAARQRRLPQIGDGQNRVDLTYVSNVVDALMAALDAAQAVGNIYTITNGEHPALWPTLLTVIRRLGLDDRVRRLPYRLAYALAAGMEWRARLLGKEPRLTRYTVAILGRTQTYDITAARRDLGYEPRVSVADGIEQTLAAWKETPVMAETESLLECHILDTGYCLASEHHLIRGGRRTKVACHSIVALLGHPRHGWLLWDAGYAPRLLDATQRLPFRLYRWVTPMHLCPELAVANQLAGFGLKTHDIRCIVLSHFHADHIAGLRDFPQAEFVAAGAAYDDVRRRTGLRALSRAFVPALLPDDFERRARLLADFHGPALGSLGPTHDLFGDGTALLVSLPGHARGQIGLLARTVRGSLLFAADSCWLSASYRENTPPHRMTEFFIDDAASLRTTIGNLHAFARDRAEVAIVPSHCPEAFRRFVEARA